MIKKLKINERALLIIGLLVLLPAIIGGVYYVQKMRTEASASAVCLNPIAVRNDTISGTVSCTTDVPVLATLMCSIGQDGVQFFCGKDGEPTMSHTITINNLNPNTGYYISIDTNMEEPVIVYLPASPDNPAFSLNYEAFSEDTLWLCREDEGFDPALDINQDGCINLLDSMYFFEDDEEDDNMSQ